MDYLKVSNFNMDIFWKEKAYYKIAEKLAYENKTIDGYDEEKGFIVKDILEIEMNGFSWFNRVAYKLEIPSEINNSKKNSLIVMFMSADGFKSPVAIERFSSKSQQNGLSKQVDVDNLFVLRISDSNWINGSWYRNTENYKNYQDEVNRLIKSVAHEHHVDDQCIVLYGTSRGGAGVFLYSMLYGYKGVAIDPLISTEFRKENRYLQFDYMKGFIEQLNLSVIPNKELKIITSDQSSYIYPWISKIDMNLFDIYNLSENIGVSDSGNYHAAFIAKSYPLAIHLIQVLLNKNFEKNDQVSIENFDVYPPYWIPKYYWTVKFDGSKGYILERSANLINPKQTDRWAKFEFRKSIELGKTYSLSIKSNEDVEILLFTNNGEWKKVSVHPGKKVQFSADKNYKGLALSATMYPKKFQKVIISEISLQMIE